jgi:hypothetical protein
VGFVEIQAAHYPRRAADGFYLLSLPGDYEVTLRRAHRPAFSYGDYARLNAPLGDGRRQALPDALRELESFMGALHHAANLSKKRVK